MKRRINARFSLIAAVGFILGIFAFYELLFGEFYFGLAVAIVLAALLIFCIIKRLGTWKVVLIGIAFALAGFCWSGLYYLNITDDACGISVSVTGRVTDLGRNGAISNIYYLEDCRDDNGRTLAGRVRVYVDDGSVLSTGDVATVSGTLDSVYPVKQQVNTFYLRNRVRYELRNGGVVSVHAGKLKLDEKVRKYVYDVTFDYMPDNSGTMYALLTGDRNALDETSELAFSRAGIVHLLAVSGLHVGFIASVLGFALSRLKLRPLTECAIIIVPLLFYAYICGFSPSVMRAITMLVCGYISRALFSKSDMLASLCWAALISLAVCPYYIFDLGFQLSFLSVFGISTLYYPLNRLLLRKKVNKHLRRICDALFISACCIVATLFTLAANGGEVAVFGVLLNLIAVPAVSVAFVLGFFGLLPWVFHYLMFAADAFLQFVLRCAAAVSELSFATFSFKTAHISAIVVIVLLFAIGGFLHLSKLGKKIFYPVCCFLLIFSIIFAYIPRRADNNAYVVYGSDDSVTVAAVVGDEAIVVSDFSDYSAVSEILGHIGKYKVDKITLFVARSSLARSEVIDAVKNCGADTVYILDSVDGLKLTDKFGDETNVFYQRPNTCVGETLKVRSIFDGELCAVNITLDKTDICLVYGTERSSSVLDFGINAEFYLLEAPCESYSSAKVKTLTPYQSGFPCNYGANKYGNFTIAQKGDTIILSFR